MLEQLIMKVATTIYIAFLLSLAPAITSFGQEGYNTPEDVSFFILQAWEDAVLEQQLKISEEEDQHDFWEDQKNFEMALKKNNYKDYKLYLYAKCEAYAAHEAQCSDRCKHGSHFVRQAAFYARYRGKVQALSSEVPATVAKIAGVVQ